MDKGKRNLIITGIALLAAMIIIVTGIGVINIAKKINKVKNVSDERKDGNKAKDNGDEENGGDGSEAEDESEAETEETEYDTEEIDGLITVYSDDKGFSTKLPDTVETLWRDEYEYRGGLYVYPNETDSMPSLEIRRFRNVGSSPEDFLENEYTAFMIRNTTGNSVPLDLTEITDLEEYEIGGKELPMKEYTMEANNGDIYNVRSFAMLDKDRKTGDDVIIYFDAKNFAGNQEYEDWAMSSLDTAVEYFRLYNEGSDDVELKDAPGYDYKAETDVSSSDYETVTSGDGLYHTSCLKNRFPEWLDEEGYWGGIGIYPDESNAYPYNQVRMYEYISNSPAEFLDTEYTGYIERLDDASDKIDLIDTEGPYMYEIGGRRMPGILFTVEHSNGDIYKQFVLADKEKDEASGKEYLVQFCAGYFTNDEDDRDWAMEGLDAAVRGFGLE